MLSGSTFQFVDDYEMSHVARPKSEPSGVALLMGSHGGWLDIVPSPSASYLLPDLAEFSPVRKESARFGNGQIKLQDQCVIYVMVGPEDNSGAYMGLSAPMRAAPSVELVVAPGLFGSAAIVESIGGGSLQLPSMSDVAPQAIVEPGLVETRASVMDAEALANVAGVTRQESVEAGVTKVAILAADASVAEIASRIAKLSGLDDGRLSKLFKVERETFCRWRTGALTNPRDGNRRRLGLLLRVLEDLSERRVQVRNWLLNQAPGGGLTPYELLERGRIDEVAYLAASIGAEAAERDQKPRSVSEATDKGMLVFDDDDQWTIVDLEDTQHDL